MEATRMFTFSCRLAPFPQARARGFSLVVALIFLLVLSMLGIVGIRNVILHERMSGNTQDWNLAFQAAEAALRDGEADAIARAAFIADYDLSNCSESGVCSPSEDGTPLWISMSGVNDGDPCWIGGTGDCAASQQYGAHTDEPALTDPNTSAALGLQPRYVIENLGLIRGLKKDSYNANDLERYAFRITAVGFGRIRTPAGDPATRVVLQTTIGPK